MKDITKYRGIIPAFYACYAPDGSISTEGVKALTRHLIAKGVKGVYVGGSSGECIYQHPDERKAVLEAVMSEAKGNLYAVMKEILRRMYGLELGGVRAPLANLAPEDEAVVAEAQKMIEEAIAAL